MGSFFDKMDLKTMLRVNFFSILITGICVIFALYIFLGKGSQPNIEEWKYISILIGLVIVSLLFLGSVASFVLFIIIKNRKKK